MRPFTKMMNRHNTRWWRGLITNEHVSIAITAHDGAQDHLRPITRCKRSIRFWLIYNCIRPLSYYTNRLWSAFLIIYREPAISIFSFHVDYCGWYVLYQCRSWSSIEYKLVSCLATFVFFHLRQLSAIKLWRIWIQKRDQLSIRPITTCFYLPFRFSPSLIPARKRTSYISRISYRTNALRKKSISALPHSGQCCTWINTKRKVPQRA